ncbi:MAG: FxsA family protein [Candidatus Omnitrophota bacterium]
MFGYLVILFTVLPAVELALLIHVGTYIGAANTILLIIATGVAGAYLARLQGFLVVQRIQSSLNKGALPTDDMLDGLMIFAGGIVLLTPGFITDALGFLLLIPLTRSLIKHWVHHRLQIHVSGHKTPGSTGPYQRRDRRLDAEDAEFYD